MYIEVMSCKPTVTTSLQPTKHESILCWRRHVYAFIKKVYIFLDKHVNQKKGHLLWYIQGIGEWETWQKRYYGSFAFFSITTQKTL